MATELKITKTQNGVVRSFIFESGEVKNLDPSTSNQSVSLTIPTEDATQDSEYKVDLGVQRRLNFSFKLYKQTTDRSEGTNPSTVKTFGEIRDYLFDTIGFPFGLAEYALTWTDKFGSRTETCSFEDLNFPVNQGIYPTGNFSFKVKRKGA